jgi:hypothetical protein
MSREQSASTRLRKLTAISRTVRVRFPAGAGSCLFATSHTSRLRSTYLLTNGYPASLPSYNISGGYNVPRMILLRDLQAAMRLDRKDMCVCVCVCVCVYVCMYVCMYVSTCTNYDSNILNAIWFEVVALIRHARFYISTC